jgi:hypothetical protein
MLVDGGAMVNIMPYSTFKNLGKTDAELVKMNMMLTGIRGDGPIDHKGVASMELTVGSKMIPTAFFIAVVEGNYNIIPDAFGFIQTIVFLLICINSWFNGLMRK